METRGKYKRDRMNFRSRTIKYTELALIIFVWMVLLMTPVLFREDNNFLIFSVLIVGFDTGLLSGLRWIGAENEKVRLEKENVATQLTLLRTQVSPHFFMNTLNNIHALVDSNTEEAKEAIIKLSKMMRYLLYETETEKTTLKKEVEFLESYINLMKLRFSEKVRITMNLPAVVPEASIPPHSRAGTPYFYCKKQ